MLTESYTLRPNEKDFRIMLATDEHVSIAWVRDGVYDYTLSRISQQEMSALLEEWKRREPVAGRPKYFSTSGGVIKVWPAPNCETAIIVQTEVDWVSRREREDFELRRQSKAPEIEARMEGEEDGGR